MKTRNIPAQEWIEFFDNFSRAHVGWPVTIKVLDAASGPQSVANNLPLEGISFDQKGTRAGGVQISAGTGSGRHVNHVIDLPLHIRAADETDGSLDFQFEPANGPVTLLHVHQPVQ